MGVANPTDRAIEKVRFLTLAFREDLTSPWPQIRQALSLRNAELSAWAIAALEYEEMGMDCLAIDHEGNVVPLIVEWPRGRSSVHRVVDSFREPAPEFDGIAMYGARVVLVEEGAALDPLDPLVAYVRRETELLITDDPRWDLEVLRVALSARAPLDRWALISLADGETRQGAVVGPGPDGAILEFDGTYEMRTWRCLTLDRLEEIEPKDALARYGALEDAGRRLLREAGR